LAQVRDYELVDLGEYYDLAPPAQSVPLEQALAAMFASAPTGAVYLLDSRIALPSSMQDDAIDRHLWELRRIAPAALPSLKGLAATPEASSIPQPAGGE
jgi:hypothetical protein